MADRPHRLPPSSDSTPSKKPSTLKERARNALITGTAGGYLGGMLVEGTTRVKIPALTRKLLRLKRKTVGIHGARTGALAGALIGARNRGERSETADAVATGGDWKFQNRIDRREAEGQRGGNWIPNSAPLLLRPFAVKSGVRGFSAFIEDMTFSALSKDVQTEVLRFVDAKKGTPVVHYGMGVKELLAKADAVNLASARKALGTLRASRARDEVLGKIKDGSKYILLMNDRIVDGHHFLAKAERGNVTSSLNVLDLTPARLSTGKVTEFAEAEPRRNRTRDLRDKIGLAKDVAGLGVTVGAGVGAHKLYKGGKQVLRKVGPQIGAAAKAWHKAALKTGKTLDTVKDAVAPAAGVNRGVASVGRKIVQGARRVAAFLHSDPRPVMEFSDERKAQWNAALLGAAAPVAAGGLVLGTRGGRNALRGLLSKVDKGDPRRLRRVVLNQKRKDASIKRNAAKAVGKAREQFRAEALPKAPKEPGLKDAVKTVRQRAKRKIVNAVANIGANPAETKFEAAPRDKLSKARDAALLTAGVAGTGAVVYGAHKLRGLKSSPTLRKGKAIAENVRNATSITADAGRIYNYLKEPVVRPKRIVAGMRRGWKQGLKEGQSAPAPKWKKGVIKIGKKLRLLEAASPSLRFSKSPRLQSFAIGGLVGSGIGTLIGSQIGERFKYKTRNALKKKLIPKLGQKWGRRVARAGAFIPENAGAAAGGVVGSIAGGGIRRTEMRNAECGMTNFGGKEQLKEIDSGAFPDPLDVFIGRKKGYAANTVKSYHREKNYVKDVRSGKRKGTPQAVAAAESEMKRLRGESVDASHGQVYRSLLKKGDTVRRVSERGGGLIRDAVKHVKGEAREKDAWGRQKKREWEKPWFQRTKNQVAAAAALGGGALLLKKNPRLRAKVDRGVRHVQRKVNSVVPDFFTGVKPLRTKGQKTAASVNAKRQSVAQAKAAKTQASVAAQAQKIAAAAKAVKAPKPKRGNGTPPLKGLARLNGRLIQFSDDPLDVGWDLRDARGRSARVFAPGAGSRDRRPKKWHEKVENERKLWGAAALTGTLAGGVGVRKIMQKTVKTAVQAERSRIGKRVVEVSRKRAAQAAMRQAEVEAKRGNLRVHSEPAAKRVA